LQDSWASSLREFQKPLGKVITGVTTLVAPGSTRSPMLENYSAALKTMLVFCAERVITMLNIRYFRGKIMKALGESLLEEEMAEHFWSIPDRERVVLVPEEIESSGLPWGLRPTLLRLPGVDNNFISQREITTTPSYLEQFNGQFYGVLSMPLCFFRYLARVKVLFLKSSLNQRVDIQASFDYGIFDEPSYAAVGVLSDERRVKFLDDLAEVVGNSYEAEWWFLITERHKAYVKTGMFLAQEGYPYLGKLEDFPVTKSKFETWMTKMNQVTFIIRSRAFNAGIAEITGVDEFIRMAFLDTERNPSLDKKSEWNRSTSRRVMHLVCAELLKVEKLAPECAKEHFSLHAFKKRVAHHFSGLRNQEGDLSPAIMWRTDTSKDMVKWTAFSPLLMNISENHVPSAPRVEEFAPAPAVTFADPRILPNGKKRKDTFYRHLLLNRGSSDKEIPAQLNQIILYRCMLWLNANFSATQNVNLISARYTMFRIGAQENSLIPHIFHTVKQLTELGKSILKKMLVGNDYDKKIQRTTSEVNKVYWPKYSDDQLDYDLFVYPADIETKMEGYLVAGNYEEAFFYAQDGYLTKHFLRFLVAVRQEMNGKMARGEPHARKDSQKAARFKPK
jgi:hypothetical protein